VAELDGALDPFLVADVDDPRVQFADRLVRRSKDSRYAVFAGPRRRALWTATGLDPDTAVLPGVPVRMTIDRAAGVRAASITLEGPFGQQQPVAWRITAAGKPVASGRLGNGVVRTVVLRAPRCRSRPCRPWSWRLTASGPGVPAYLPVYGPPEPARQVALLLQSVHLQR
jgi:hypothetical protein